MAVPAAGARCHPSSGAGSAATFGPSAPPPARPEQPAMLTFAYPRSEHLCLIFTGSTVSISELQNFHAPGPALSKMHSGRLARWAINNLLYVLQMLHKRTVFYHGALTSGPLG